ncbi:DJ-1/PfpI family protein [Hypoxylon crocopeplum]|nr:DJ-1/PfpI family protein [Hypoxylon crocopeplum]
MEDLTSVVDSLQVLAQIFPMSLSILSSTLDTVSTEPPSNNSLLDPSFWPGILPSHTFATAPKNIEVLIVPGGPGMISPEVSAPAAEYIRDVYPQLRYLLTICTGAGIAARSGVLDGRRATTNKQSWATITAMGPKTIWVSPARWVVDGNIWSSSGVTAGLDLTYAWIQQIWGEEWAMRVSGMLEYVPHPQDFDPFAEIFNVTPSG